MIGKFRMEDRKWSIVKKANFEAEDKLFAKGCFCMVFKVKSEDERFKRKVQAVKNYNSSSKRNLEKMKETCKSHKLFKYISLLVVC